MPIDTVTTCTINHMEQKPDTETDSHVVEEISILYGTRNSTATHTHTHTHTQWLLYYTYHRPGDSSI